MTEPGTLLVALLALGVAVAAGWFLRPRVPALDGERWFKVMLATVIRGEVEAVDGAVAEWERRVVRFVPYHPAGRLPERKVVAPHAYAPPGPALEGEIGLVEALTRIPGRAARWARLYDEDEAGLEARLGDPVELGDDYDPATWLGPGGGWEDLAAWGRGEPSFWDVLSRRLDATWALVRGAPSDAPDVLGAMAEQLGEAAEVLPFVEEEPAAASERVGQALAAKVPGHADRIVLVAEGEAAHLVLRALSADAALRDRTLAVLSVGGALMGRGDDGPYGRPVLTDWMGHWFAHHHLDTEAQRLTPYLCAEWLDRAADPPGALGLTLADQRFPEPADEGDVGEWVRPIDLGPLPLDPDLPVVQVARALVAVVGCVVLAKR